MGDKKILEFLDEYEKLCREYQIIIDSCGCCQSPFLFYKSPKLKPEFVESDIDRNIKHLKEECFGDNFFDKGDN